jgi:IMP dehydrogenase
MEKIKFKALTYDDVLLLPRYSDFTPKEASLRTNLTREISLNLPIISAAMDTVTESRMAIAMAESGGIGVIHKNNTIEDQATHVRTVKKYESGIVKDPITIESTQSIEDLVKLTSELNISGMPVVDNGVLKGIVTVNEGTDQDEVKKLMYQNRIEKVLVLDKAGSLSGLVTMKDIDKSAEFPLATKDTSGQLLVAAALGTGTDTLDRAEALNEMGVDVFVVDSAHGHSKNVIETIKLLKNNFKDVQVIAGNVATPEGAVALDEAGADAIKIGMGPGSICTTRIIAGMGVPQITAILSIKDAMKNSPTPLIADGGIRFSGDLAKAIAAGASSVMLGSMLAGTEEAPGEIELYQGRSFKTYRGMGSLGAMSERNDANRYSQDEVEAEKLVPEGVEGRVPYKGVVVKVLDQFEGGLRQSMGYVGCKTIESMQTETEFIEVTNAGMMESHVHDVMITKEAPNYQRS